MRGIKNSIRLLNITYVLARHDMIHPMMRLTIFAWFLWPLRLLAVGHIGKRPGQRLRSALTAMGPTYIKFGQALSTRPDLVGEEVAEDLSTLQDNLPPFSFKKAKRAIEKDLGKPLSALFKHFEPKPVAAASIAQVHFAETHEGKKVAVKVLRPKIEARFERDIDLLMWLAEKVEKRIPDSKRLKPVEVIQLFAETSRMEMDLRYEAAAASELKENFRKDTGFKVPKVHWRLTSLRVLTTTRVRGINISHYNKIVAAGHDPDKLIAKAGEVFFKQVFRDGFFHADMHPGNVFIDKKGNIVVVDFGIMGRVDRKTRMYLAEMLKGFFERDYAKVSRVHFDAGYVPATESPERFAQACRAIAEPIFGLPQNEISIGKLLAMLFKVTREFNMETQPQLLLLQKTLVMAEGLGRMLNPKVNIWQMASPYISEWASENLGPKARAKHIKAEIGDALVQFRALLHAGKHLAEAITPQGLRLHPDTINALRKDNKKQCIKRIIKTITLILFTAVLASAVSVVTALQLLGYL